MVDSEAVRGTKRKAVDHPLPLEAPKRIKPLDQNVVNKIAAGEIIVAPVHALKELVENAVDAGTTSIDVLVKDGGLKLLQITDSGHGINKDDLPILCERFTTSKLKAFEDLTSIGTYGFRGEALASISHIAHLYVTTKTEESSCAYKAYYVAGKLAPLKPGQSADPKPCAGRQGTQITVEDLFHNIPTRRRAFRSAAEEYNKILDLVGRYAVHCHGIAFSCKKHGDSSMGVSVPAAATAVDRIRIIHGTSVANELIHLEVENDRWGFKSEGYVSNANHHAKKLTLLLFINHRSVESSTIKKAVEQTYSTFLPKGSHPFVYLSLEIDPARVDVNVHPTKREVNFLNEDEIVDLVCEEIRAALGKVDTSRTFTTQTLLPGVRIPTISSTSLPSPPRRTQTQKDSDNLPQTPMSSSARPAQTKIYENNLVRTDSKLRKITSMLPPTTPRPNHYPPLVSQASSSATENPADMTSEYAYTYDATRQPATCRLQSIRSLRAAVLTTQHNTLTDMLATHTFVGIVDDTRRIAAIQSGVKLLLVDYAALSHSYFYQLGLTDFGNFGRIELSQPLDLYETLLLGAEDGDDTLPSVDWPAAARKVHEILRSRRTMLAEYFSLDISEDGTELLALPLMLKGYLPSMAKLPRFLLRLGPAVDWQDEKECFRSFLTELAAWHVPEALPAEGPRRPKQHGPSADGMMSDDADMVDADAVTDASEDAATAGRTRPDVAADAEIDANGHVDVEIEARRRTLHAALETVLFPAFRARLVATKALLGSVVEVADLKGLYRVFERC